VTTPNDQGAQKHTAELLPCPFCGYDQPELQSEYDQKFGAGVAGWANVRCGNCFTCGPTTTVEHRHNVRAADLEASARGEWNQRVGIPDPAAMLSKVREALEACVSEFNCPARNTTHRAYGSAVIVSSQTREQARAALALLPPLREAGDASDTPAES
jgi:hypothetical protein